MFRNCRIVVAVVFLTVAFGTGAVAATSTTTDPLGTHQLQMVNADGYYSPNGNGVTWPQGPGVL